MHGRFEFCPAMRPWTPVFAAVLTFAAAPAEDLEGFVPREDGALLHTASGFVCPEKIGSFERDAAGRQENGDYCAYSALSGVYGTIVLRPLHNPFDPAAVLAPEFRMVERMGGKMLSETVQPIGSQDAAIPVFLRTYEMARLDTLTYRTQLASAAIGAWTVEVTIEYAHPRDKEEQTGFVTAVYGEAAKDLAPAQ